MKPTLTAEFRSLYEVLRRDVDAICKPRSSPDGESYRYPDPAGLEQSERRSLVRATFAQIEGVAFFMRQLLLNGFIDSIPTLTRLALGETQVDLSPSGKVSAKPLRVSAQALLRLTFSVFAEAFPQAQALKCEGPGFEALVASTLVRDRLMHPRSVASTEVTDDEVRRVLSAFVWFNDAIAALLEIYVSEFESHVRKLRSDGA